MKTIPTKLLLLPEAVAPLAGVVMASKSPQQTRAAQIARSHYLVTYGGCGDCHTPLKMGERGPEPDSSRLLSGNPCYQESCSRSGISFRGII
ncbi:MAG: hypothetical protein KIS67_16505 [Verrucomicrobiae bacterium]|nr:hypothetical protein [Verrucomicrobiae bacterium]